MLVKEKTRNSKYYSVGYSPTLNKFILCEPVSYIAWYNRYYEITEAEYSLTENNIESLDHLVKICFKDNLRSERFLCSERICENSKQQFLLLQELKRGFIPYDYKKEIYI